MALQSTSNWWPLCVCLLAALQRGSLGRELRGIQRHAAQHPWPTMRGPLPMQFGATSAVLPRDLWGALAWKWNHPKGRFHTLISGGPVIDSEGSVYVTTNDGIRKFSQQGRTLWFAPQTNRHLNNQAALLDDMVLNTNEDGEAFALSAATGATIWRKRLALRSGGDAGYPAGYDGVFVAAADYGKDRVNEGGNAKIFGLNASTGAVLWQFAPKHPVWNFAPLFPGDDTTLFMDFTGGTYRLGLHNGSLLWQRPTFGTSFSDGGAVLGPDNALFTCSNLGTGHGIEGSQGLLRALRISDGELLWRQVLAQPCNSYPAVGRLGPQGQLSVAVTPGSFMGSPGLHGSIMTFDAATGTPQWQFNAHPYTTLYKQAKGDVEGLEERKRSNGNHVICLPAHWSSANIAGDGTVYAARADGYMYGVRGPSNSTAPVSLSAIDRDFATTPGVEVRVWNLETASLHGAFAFAPGKMAVATCDTLFVFNLF